MFNEYDLVMAKRDLSESVSQGCIGTVLLVFTEPSIAYEVEFVDKKGNTLDVLTVHPDDVKPGK